MAEHLDESLLDPQLQPNASRSGTQVQTGGSVASSSTPFVNKPVGFIPIHGPPANIKLDDYYPDESVLALPLTSSRAFDFCLNSTDTKHPGEYLWIMGLQAGIGMGIYGAREAILNEMQNQNTAFGQAVKSSPSLAERRQEIGEACQKGFDRRVAFRVAMNYSMHCQDFINVVVKSGRTDLLPETGNHLFGTGPFFDDERAALCHQNAQRLNDASTPPSLQTDDSTGGEQAAPAAAVTESSPVGGRFNAGVDMTQLDPTIAPTAGAAKAAYHIGTDDEEHAQHATTSTGDVQEAAHQGMLPLGDAHEAMLRDVFPLEPLGDDHDTMQQRISPSGNALEVMQCGPDPSGNMCPICALDDHGRNFETNYEATSAADNKTKMTDGRKRNRVQNARLRTRKPKTRSTGKAPATKRRYNTGKKHSAANANDDSGYLTNVPMEQDQNKHEQEEEMFHLGATERGAHVGKTEGEDVAGSVFCYDSMF